LLYGIGVGFATAQLTGVIMAGVPLEKIGQASGSQSTVRQIGSALGIAVLGTILFTSTQASAEERIRATEFAQTLTAAQQDEFVTAISTPVVDSAGAALPGITQFLVSQGAPQKVADEVQLAANNGFTDGVKATGYAAAGFLFLGLLTTINLGARKPKKTAAPVEAEAGKA
jgi:hypothetical protein